MSTTSRASISTCRGTASSSSPACRAPGKSSLAFDTIFAEGQRRYVESLSAYARQFLGQMDKPDVDFIEGLSPAVSIDQKSTSRNPRSTVGTITEVYDYLRLLYARAGTPHCPTCGEIISKQTPQQIVDQVLDMEPGRRFQVLAPVIRGRKGEYVDLFSQLQGQGYSRVLVDGTVHPLSEPPTLKKQEKHDIAVVVDRLSVKASAKQRLTDSVETGAAARPRASSSSSSSTSPRTTRTASAASPSGWPARTATSSRWTTSSPAPSPSTRPTARAPRAPAWASRRRSTRSCSCPTTSSRWPTAPSPPGPSGQSAEYFTRLLTALSEQVGFRMDAPWRKLSARVQKAVLHGSDDQVHVRYRNRYGRERSYYASFEGVVPFLERRLDQAESDSARERYEGYMRDVPCPACGGTRLKPEILAVTLRHESAGRPLDRRRLRALGGRLRASS